MRLAGYTHYFSLNLNAHTHRHIYICIYIVVYSCIHLYTKQGPRDCTFLPLLPSTMPCFWKNLGLFHQRAKFARPENCAFVLFFVQAEDILGEKKHKYALPCSRCLVPMKDSDWENPTRSISAFPG